LNNINIVVSVLRFSLQEAWRDDKGFEICTAGLEFELGRAPLVRAWDSRGFTCSPGPIKYTFLRVRFPRIKKKKIYTQKKRKKKKKATMKYELSYHDILSRKRSICTSNQPKRAVDWFARWGQEEHVGLSIPISFTLHVSILLVPSLWIVSRTQAFPSMVMPSLKDCVEFPLIN
jgi:hypothetical protein